MISVRSRSTTREGVRSTRVALGVIIGCGGATRAPGAGAAWTRGQKARRREAYAERMIEMNSERVKSSVEAVDDEERKEDSCRVS
jgi:hypothetical protein